ncbi:hypothetical protein [Parvularcula marina]|uniref:Acyl-protein synthetase LuxE domain-containing protein n=1 Tax=Parvularcula marina TaxID=2292771 RepID=A0A371RLC7_9PROT|nr:hypothetical protein [Parvularcula marina]RFB06243.1 hypothetical protein DX908_13790 [Parvularcula marina]
MNARQTLLDKIADPALFEWDPDEVEALQLEAAREVFAERRQQIPVLDRRARDVGIESIEKLEDLVPLLFFHTTYKSYPSSFVEKGKWKHMLQWLTTLSTADVTDVDVEGVETVDDWIARLRAAGHRVLATSGSSGKVSFLNQSEGDYQRKKRHFTKTMGWPFVKPAQDRPFFSIGPSKGFNSAVEASNIQAEIWGREGDIHFLTDDPLLIADVSAGASLRTRMAAGTATPSEIESFREKTAQQGTRMNERLTELAEMIIAKRKEPVFVAALWAQHMMIIERARELGVGDGEFHPDSVVAAGGGVKGVKLPPDYKEQVTAFYGNVVRPMGYGMTEMAQRWPACEHKRYHRPPGLIMLPLEREGERLLTREDAKDGVVEGRFAFLDLLFDGRWGGIISGDKVQVDFGRCPCGRPGPTLLDTITRYAQPGEDDHIGCAGTIDSYVKGALTQ